MLFGPTSVACRGHSLATFPRRLLSQVVLFVNGSVYASPLSRPHLRRSHKYGYGLVFYLHPVVFEIVRIVALTRVPLLHASAMGIDDVVVGVRGARKCDIAS